MSSSAAAVTQPNSAYGIHWGKVGYRHGEKGAELETMYYLEFIARVTSHIPDKGQVMVRYDGLSANAHRGKVR